jgi:hypothetical protein
LIESIVERLKIYELHTRTGTPMDINYLSSVLYDLWMPCYLNLITDPKMTLADHDAMLLQRITPFLTYVFDDSTLTATRLSRTEKRT